MKIISSAVAVVALCIGAAGAQERLRGLAEGTYVVNPIEKNVVSPNSNGATVSGVGATVTLGTTSATATYSVPAGDATDRLPFTGTCSSNPVCAELALEGDCCPTTSGKYLDCCHQTCMAHPMCAHLEGDCCPSADGIMLECCDLEEQITEARQAVKNNETCSSHAACVGLADVCCPTSQGVMLDCCDKD